MLTPPTERDFRELEGAIARAAPLPREIADEGNRLLDDAERAILLGDVAAEELCARAADWWDARRPRP